MTYADVNAEPYLGDSFSGPSFNTSKDKIGLREFLPNKLNYFKDMPDMVVLKNSRGETVRMRKADWLKSAGQSGDLKALLDGKPSIEKYEKDNKIVR